MLFLLADIGREMQEETKRTKKAGWEQLCERIASSVEGGSPNFVESFLRVKVDQPTFSVSDSTRALQNIQLCNRYSEDMKATVRTACVVLILHTLKSDKDSARVLRALQDGGAATLQVSCALFSTALTNNGRRWPY